MDIKTICIVGLGYVGLPLAAALSNHFSVIGFDVKAQRIKELQEGKDLSGELSKESLLQNNIVYTTDPTRIKEALVVIICVPTPIDEHNKPDLKYVESATTIVGKNLSRGAVIVYESTVYPGVTENICVPLLEEYSGLRCGDGFKVGYSPERINPGDKEHTIDKVVKIVSGSDAEALEVIDKVYSTLTATYRAPSIKVAEAAKVIENIQRDLNIALMNELTLIFDKMDIDMYQVLEAAETKWNFHAYQPGLVGGHCFDQNSVIIVRDRHGERAERIGPFVEALPGPAKIVGDTTLLYPSGLEVLSYDVDNATTSFQAVSFASKRKCSEILHLHCPYNYQLAVTAKHPVIVYDKGLKVKLAQDVVVGDQLVLSKTLPTRKKCPDIDLLAVLPPQLYAKIRVKFRGRKVSEFRTTLNRLLPGKKGNYYVWDYLPLKVFLQVEKKLGVSRQSVYLCTGRGPSFKKFPCIFPVDSDLARLLGYYLSEGCITRDRSLRTRFTFHRKETEYIRDVQDLLRRRGIDFSVYQDKTYQSTVIKVSSDLFGMVFRDILGCGTNCYTMNIPWMLMETDRVMKEELLKGIFRGDGGVTRYFRARTYHKSGKEFTHENNSITISFFTSSPTLFQQVVLLCLHFDLLPKMAKREGYLTITGPGDVARVRRWFLGEKKKKIDLYLHGMKKKVVYPHAQHLSKMITLEIQGIERRTTDTVYSLEVPATGTFITSYGIIAHNCIGVDPYYLTYKAQELGYEPKVILAGREINDGMHHFYAQKILQRLSGGINPTATPAILIVGLTFKPNVPDYRNSRIRFMMEELQRQNVEVYAYDPFVEKSVVEREFKVGWKSPTGDLSSINLVVIAVEHRAVKELVARGVFAGKAIVTLRELVSGS